MKRDHSFLIIIAIVVSVLFFPAQLFATEIILKKGRTLEAKIIMITDKDIKVDLGGVEMTYVLDEVKSIHGMADINKTKLEELVKLGKKDVDEATAGPTRDEEKCTEGINILKKIEELDIPGMQADKDVVEALRDCKRHPESVPYIQKMLKKNAESAADAHMELGNVYRHDKTKEKEAVAEYEKAIQITGVTSTSTYQMGITYLAYEKYDKALPYFEKLLTMNPDRLKDSIRAQFFIGRCCFA